MYKLCPTCKVKVTKMGKFEWFFSGLMFAGCLTFVGIGVLLIPFTPLLLLMPTRYRCKVCKNDFKEAEVLVVDRLV